MMSMDFGFTLLALVMAIEGFLILLLVMPMPSNMVRGALTRFVTGLWDQTAVKGVSIVVMAINTLYLWHVVDVLLSPLIAMGFLVAQTPLDSCEVRVEMLEKERNATVCGVNLFFFLILRRLVDIQMKLHESRADAKSANHIPMGRPVKAGHFD